MAEDWLIYMALIIPGSAAGGMARHGLSAWIGRRTRDRFPAGTLVVNVSGALAIGFIAAWRWTEAMALADPVSVFLIYGFLGGYTTVSSFSLQTLHLLREGRSGAAAANMVASYGLCLLAVFAGVALAGGF